MATPYVTGVAALLLSLDPGLTTMQIKNAIMKNVDKSPNYEGLCVSGGRLNAFNALSSVLFKRNNQGNEFNSSSDMISGLNYAYYGELIIPEFINGTQITRIDTEAFKNKTGITSIVIPDSIEEIKSNAFLGCSALQSIIVDENNREYTTVDGILYNKAKTRILNIPQALAGDVKISAGISAISSNMFAGRSNINAITIPYTVTDIGYNAFYNCSSLTKVTIERSSACLLFGGLFKIRRI